MIDVITAKENNQRICYLIEKSVHSVIGSTALLSIAIIIHGILGLLR